LYFSAVFHGLCRQPEQAKDRVEASMALAQHQGFPLWVAMGPNLHGWALVQMGRADEGLSQIRQGIGALDAIGVRNARTAFCALLAEAYGQSGQPEEGLGAIAEALAAIEQTGERLYEAELHRLKGELTLAARCRSNPNAAAETPPASRVARATAQEAEGCFRAAIEIARQQQAKSWELRATISLSRLWRTQRNGAGAYALLSEVLEGFTENGGTPDHQAATDLLRALAPHRSR
jgi:predicted ATPase